MLDALLLITLADAFGNAAGLSRRQVSWRALGDTKKLDAIADGADITVKRLNAAVVWFDTEWPDDLAWPAGVIRPSFALADGHSVSSPEDRHEIPVTATTHGAAE